MRLDDAARTVLATARLTRFVTRDVLGEWTVVGPLRQWADRNEPGDVFGEEATGPRHMAVTGLDCPFCVGTWIGFGVLGSYAAARAAGPQALRAWRFVTSGLALNYVVGHVSARID